MNAKLAELVSLLDGEIKSPEVERAVKTIIGELETELHRRKGPTTIYIESLTVPVAALVPRK